MGQAVDDAAPLNDGLPTDPAARALLPPELLGHAPRRPPPAPRRPAKKRPRSMSEAAVFSDRLVALDEAQREEPEEEEPPVEEDEPDDLRAIIMMRTRTRSTGTATSRCCRPRQRRENLLLCAVDATPPRR